MWIFLNDRLVEKEHARISVFDHGFLYGDGVYETLRAYKGRIFLLERHIARLRQSCELIGLEPPIQDEAWISIFTQLLVRNGLEDAALRLTISRGEGELGIDPSLCVHPTVVVMAKPVVGYPVRHRERGMCLHLASIRRNPESAQSPRIKSLSFLNNILAKREAIEVGADDALMLNMEGHLTECTASNVFFITNNRLHTPAVHCGILTGITRDVVIELARDIGIQVEEGRYVANQLLQADECFITNTGMEIMPVSTVGESSIGKGKIGPLTAKLSEAFQTHLNQFLGPCLTASTL